MSRSGCHWERTNGWLFRDNKETFILVNSSTLPKQRQTKMRSCLLLSAYTLPGLQLHKHFTYTMSFILTPLTTLGCGFHNLREKTLRQSEHEPHPLVSEGARTQIIAIVSASWALTMTGCTVSIWLELTHLVCTTTLRCVLLFPTNNEELEVPRS